jgi:hypothetical protein
MERKFDATHTDIGDLEHQLAGQLPLNVELEVHAVRILKSRIDQAEYEFPLAILDIPDCKWGVCPRYRRDRAPAVRDF